MTTRELLSTVYGIEGDWRENPLVDEVDIAVTRILPQNPNRLAFVMFNLSANVIYIRPREQVSAAAGFRLNANGGSIIVQWDKDLILPTLQWYATAGANDSDIYILECIATR